MTYISWSSDFATFCFIVMFVSLFFMHMWVVGSGSGAGCSFQCWGILLLWHMAGQGRAVLAAGAGRVGYFYIFFISSILSSFFNASSVGRLLDILKYFGLSHYNPAVVVCCYQRCAR